MRRFMIMLTLVVSAQFITWMVPAADANISGEVPIDTVIAEEPDADQIYLRIQIGCFYWEIDYDFPSGGGGGHWFGGNSNHTGNQYVAVDEATLIQE